MEKELRLDGMELAALENEMKLNGSSIEIEKVRQFFNEIDEEKRWIKKVKNSSQQYFEDISSDDESRDKNKPSSLVPSRSGSITSSVTPRGLSYSSDLLNDSEELFPKKKKNESERNFTSKTIKPHRNTTVTSFTPTFRLLTTSSKRIADSLDLLSDRQLISFCPWKMDFKWLEVRPIA